MKKLTALLLTASLSMTLFGCNNKDAGTQKDEDDGLVSVWLMTSEISYEADGSKGYYQRTYTYNEKGMPLTESYDRGPIKTTYNEKLEIYEFEYLPYDGMVDQYYEFHYNEQGDMLYYDEIRKVYDEEGNEETEQSSHQSYGKDQYVYHYDNKGRIETVDIYAMLIGGGVADEKYCVYHYCYDDDGNLFEVYLENLQQGTKSWVYDFRYNENGQLICSTYRPREGMIFYEYDYNGNGKLSEVRQYRKAPHNSPLDDQHVIQADYAPPLEEKNPPMGTVKYTYDDKGRLISRGGANDAENTYDDNGKLKTVTYGDGKKYVYVDSDQEATGDAIYLIRDKHGNVVKEMTSDGACTVYTYQEFRLSKTDAAKCNAVQMTYTNLDITGTYAYNWLRFKNYGGVSIIPYLPLPENELLFTDTLRN